VGVGGWGEEVDSVVVSGGGEERRSVGSGGAVGGGASQDMEWRMVGHGEDTPSRV